jgi:protein HOOK3
VNTFDLPGRVTAWNQLEDGQILWQILADIDAEYFNESLPNFDESNRRTSDWIPRWQNLKHIERAVSTYIREECGQLPVLTKRMVPDLKTGARDGSTMLIAKLTMGVLLAACFSPKSNQRMLQVMAQLGTKTAETIAEAIQDMQSLDTRMSELGVDSELTPEPNLAGFRTPTRAVSGQIPTAGKDNELEQEALLFEANKDRAALRSQSEKLKEELKQSKARISQLEEELGEATLYMDERKTQVQRAQSEDVEQLRNDLARDRQYIDQLETDLANARDILESQKRRLERYQGEEGSKQDLRDQLQLIKSERDELNQRAKANENLKKKIESLTKETKHLETLREDYQQARERLMQLETVEERCEALEKVNKENSHTLVNCEQAIFEEKGKRTRVEHENLLLMKQLEQTRELQYKAEDARQELEDRIRDLETASHADRGGSLEDELTQDENTKSTEDLGSARPPTDARVSADAIALQQKVDILGARLKSLESETLKQMQENLGLRSDMMAEKDEDSEKPFLEQNEKLQTAETELEELHRRLREKDLQVAELRNELNKNADISEEAKAEGLQAEHERMLALQQKTNERLRDLELANEEKAGLLRAALLDRENLSPELLELKRAETLRQIREQIESVIGASPETQPSVLDTTSSEIAETVLSSEAALEKAKKVSNNQIPHDKSPSCAFDAAISTMRSVQRLNSSFSAATLIPLASPSRGHTEKNKSLSEISSSTAGTGQSTWGRVAHILSPKRRKESTPCGSEYFSTLTSTECVASLSLAWLPWIILILRHYSFFILPEHYILLPIQRAKRLPLTERAGSPGTGHRQHYTTRTT